MRAPHHLISLRTFGLAFAIALSPAMLQQITCSRGNTTLSSLELEVDGVNQIDFDGSRSYAASITSETAVVRAQSADPAATVSYQWWAASNLLEAGPIGVGGGEVTVDVPPGQSELRVVVRAPQGNYSNYTITVTGRDFPCTEQGIRDAIAQGGGPYTFDCNGPTSIVTTDTIVIDHDVILDAQGELTVDAAGTHRAFSVEANVTAEIRGFTVTGGVGSGLGGGAIHNEGVLVLRKSTIADNFGACGSLFNFDTATLTVVNSTISSSDGYGIDVCPFGTTALTHTTIAGFVALEIGGDPLMVAEDLTMTNTVIHGGCGACFFSGRGGGWYCIPNFSVTPAVIISTGHNIESPGDSCSFDHPTDRVSVAESELRLGALAANGGTQQTHGLFGGSIAVDEVSTSMCVDPDGAPLATDQRGIARPQGGACDIGAFEYVDCTGSPCDDGNACTADHCDPADYSWCAHTIVPDGTSCDFGGATGVCMANACVGTSWDQAERIGGGSWGSGAVGPQVAIAPGGEITVVWAATDGVFSERIWSNRYRPGVGWGTAEPIHETYDTYGGRQPRIGVDSAGHAIALWWRGLTSTSESLRSNRYTPGVGWDANEHFVGGGFVIDGHDLAVGPDGNAIAVWAQLYNGRYDIWANWYTLGVGWGEQELIESNGGSASDPRVAVDPSGNAIVVWSQGEYTPLWHADIWSNRYVPGVGWSVAELVETNDVGSASAPRLVVDSSGHATALWQQYDEGGTRLDIWSNRYTPGVGWSAPELVETNVVGSVSAPQVALDSSGQVTALWRQYDEGGTALDVWWNRYTPGAGWGVAEPLAPEVIPQVPRVAVGPSGHLTAVWVSGNDIWSNRYTPGVGWGTGVLIEGNGGLFAPDATAGSPQVAVDSSGRAVAVWAQTWSAWEPIGTIWANHSEAPEEVTP